MFLLNVFHVPLLGTEGSNDLNKSFVTHRNTVEPAAHAGALCRREDRASRITVWLSGNRDLSVDRVLEPGVVDSSVHACSLALAETQPLTGALLAAGTCLGRAESSTMPQVASTYESCVFFQKCKDTRDMRDTKAMYQYH